METTLEQIQYTQKVRKFLSQIKHGQKYVVSAICKPENFDQFKSAILSNKDWTIEVDENFTFVRKICESDYDLMLNGIPKKSVRSISDSSKTTKRRKK